MTSLKTSEVGHRGEAIAANFLQEQGYLLLKRNFRTRFGEIDIIAKEGNVLCFVEVRSRQNAESGHPLETISSHKQKRILRAADAFLRDYKACEEVRFDVVGIVYEPKLTISLIRDAFDASR